MSPSNDHKSRGIKEIADALGISIGTVDRALHNRKGVSAKTRGKVLKTAEKMNYSPNVAARNLKLNRKIRIGVYLPREIASYYDTLREGVRSAARAEASVSLDLEFYDYPSLGEGDLEVMQRTKWLRFDGIILAPGRPTHMTEVSRAAIEHEKAIVCVTTDAARMSRLASVTADSLVSGGMAAELLGGWILQAGKVAIFTGDLQVQDHADKLRGFAATLATSAPHLTLVPAVESHDSFEMACDGAKRIFKEHKDLRGLYINTANCLPVLQVLVEQRKAGIVKVIATDLFADMVPFIEDGTINASLYQRPYTQGRLALEALSGFLARGTCPKPSTRLAPHIILRSNLSLFTDTLD